MANILIIEDNQVHRLLLRHTMEDLGHVPMDFHDVDMAKESLRTQFPDLFIIDMQINESTKSTLALIKDLSKSKHTRNIPVIIISAYLAKDNIRSELPGFDLDNVIEKPFNVETITKKVKELLSGKKEK